MIVSQQIAPSNSSKRISTYEFATNPHSHHILFPTNTPHERSQHVQHMCIILHQPLRQPLHLRRHTLHPRLIPMHFFE